MEVNELENDGEDTIELKNLETENTSTYESENTTKVQESTVDDMSRE